MRPAARLTLVIVLALLIPIVPFVIVGKLPGERWLSATDDNSSAFAITGMGLLASDVLLPIPSSIVGTLLGARLGFLPGWLWAWLGLTLGNLVGYGVGRLWPARLSAELPRQPTVALLFISRPVPVLAEAMAITAGAARTPLLAASAACAAGNGIYALALAGNGAALLPDALIGPGLILPMSLPVVAWLLWRWMARQRQATNPQGDT